MYTHTPVSVAGKTAVVVGGTSGIGEAIALGFAEEDANVVATSRQSEKVQSTADALRERGASTLEITCDVSERESIERVRDVTFEEFGTVEILVASQGAISRNALENIPEEEWTHVLDVALSGVYRLYQVFANSADNASFITISSLAARLGIADAIAYSAAKGGVEALTRAAAKELAPDIRVNAIAPGYVITPQNEDEYEQGSSKRAQIEERTPMERVAEREEMVGAAVYLASDAASFTTGEVLTVDGGFADSVF